MDLRARESGLGVGERENRPRFLVRFLMGWYYGEKCFWSLGWTVSLFEARSQLPPFTGILEEISDGMSMDDHDHGRDWVFEKSVKFLFFGEPSIWIQC